MLQKPVRIETSLPHMICLYTSQYVSNISLKMAPRGRTYCFHKVVFLTVVNLLSVYINTADYNVHRKNIWP